MNVVKEKEIAKPNSWEDERPHFRDSNVLGVYKLYEFILLIGEGFGYV